MQQTYKQTNKRMEGVGSARWQEWIGLVMIPQHETAPYTLYTLYTLCVNFVHTLCRLRIHFGYTFVHFEYTFCEQSTLCCL